MQQRLNNPDNRRDGLTEIIISVLQYLAQHYQQIRTCVSKTHSGTARRFRVSLGLCACYIDEYKLIFSDENDIFFTHKVHPDVQKTKIILFHRTPTYWHHIALSARKFGAGYPRGLYLKLTLKTEGLEMRFPTLI